VVGVVGEPGMGKIRLLAEFCRRVPEDQVTVYVGQGLSYGQDTPTCRCATSCGRSAGWQRGRTGRAHGCSPAAAAAVTQVAVPPLRAQDSRTIVQAVLGAVTLPEARLQALVAQAGGNPFFVEELAWHAVEQGWRDTPCWQRAWTGCQRRRSGSSRPPPSLAPKCPCPCCKPLPGSPRHCCTAAWGSGGGPLGIPRSRGVL
jgi:hypothetical protein